MPPPPRDGELLDPLDWLRESVSGGEEVRLAGNDVVVGGIAFQRTQPCGVTLKKTGALIDLGSLCYFLNSRTGAYQSPEENLKENYTYAKVQAQGHQYISALDRKDLAAYVLGDVSTIALLVRGEPPTARVVARKRARGGDGLDAVVARAEPVNKPEAAVNGAARAADAAPAEDDGDDEPTGYEELAAVERPFTTRRTRLRQAGRDFNQTSALKFVREELTRVAHIHRRTGEDAPAPREKVVDTVARAPVAKLTLIQSLQRMRSTTDPKPYIVVPRNSATSTLINLLNVKRFLSEGIYDPPNGDLFTQYGHQVEVSGTINGEQLTFRVVDSTTGFSKKDWRMTVAVFIDGSKWQFSSWPFKTYAEMFATIKGFHVQYDESVTPRYTHNAAGERYSAAAPVKDSELDMETIPVVRLRVKRAAATRHNDALVSFQFWKELERFLLQPRKERFTSSHNL